MSWPNRSGLGLEWKVGVFTVGAVMALTGIFFEQRWLTGGAILILVVGAFWRFPLKADAEHTEARDPSEGLDLSGTPSPGDPSDPGDNDQAAD